MNAAQAFPILWALLSLAFYAGGAWIVLKFTRRDAAKLRTDLENFDRDLNGLGTKLDRLREELHDEMFRMQLLLVHAIPEDKREKVLAAIMGHK